MRRTLPTVAWVIVLCAALSTAAGCARTREIPDLTGPSKVSSDEVQFRLPRFPSGGTYDLASDRGNVVVVDVWATWCEPCRDALPMWQDVAKEYGDRGLKVYAMSVDADPNLVAKFIEDTKLSLPVLLDEKMEVAGPVLPVNQMPTTFFIDRRGVIRHVEEGFAESHLAKYQAKIEALLEESP